MALGIIFLLLETILICYGSAVPPTPPVLENDPFAEVFATNLSAEDLADRHEKFHWDGITIMRTHDKKELRLIAPPGTDGVIDLHMGLHLNRVDGLDLERGVFDCVAWLYMEWMDSRWDWTGKHDLPAVILPADMVWKPDTVLFNDDSYGGHRTLMEGDFRVQIKKNGTILYVQPLHIHSTCDGLRTHYENGENVTCHMLFGSWMFDARRLNLIADGVGGILDLTKEHENNKWKVTSVHAEKEIRGYEGYGLYADIKYSVSMEYQGGTNSTA